ncbi:MAG TPA: LuxR C-terminal-related transcriptional regulator [Streptosporangiaceae bacterium]|nr:LuxR C-terminal-related transcriptional regulator [Streptosporangiaceae bacterium]
MRFPQQDLLRRNPVQNAVRSDTSSAAYRAGSSMIHAPTSFVGRDAEFAELRNKLLDPAFRLITLTGPVAVGKSRLAAALFEDLAFDFPHGGRFVDLDDMDSPYPTDQLAAHPAAHLAAALALHSADLVEEPDAARDLLLSYLHDRDFLLVIDAGEHVLTELAPLVAGLVSACPRLTVLVAAPEPLGVYGESLVRLGPLEVPADPRRGSLTDLERVPAVQLFVHRARAVRPGFTLTEDNREAVAALCRRLDGLPLAIELAAASAKLSSPQALLADLDDDLGVISGTAADTMSRFTDMDTAIEAGLSRLNSVERAFLDRLAAFEGEFGAAAAKGVARPWAGQAAQLIESLVDKNLLLASDRPDGEVVFRLLGLVRRQLLTVLRKRGEHDEVMRAHADYFQAMARAARAGLTGAEQSWWLSRLADWHADLRAALRFLVNAGDGAATAGFAAALRLHWHAAGALREGVAWLEEGLDLADRPADITPDVHEVLGELTLSLGETRAAERRLNFARQRYEEARDPRGVAVCLGLLGRVAFHQGDVDTAERLLQESTARLRTAGEASREHALATIELARVRLTRGDRAAARKLAEAALQEFTDGKDARDVALSQYVLAEIAMADERLDEAEQLARTALLRLDDLGDAPACGTGLEILGILMTVRHGRMTEAWRRAVRDLGVGAQLRDRAGLAASDIERARLDEIIDEARVRLGDELFDEEWAAAERRPLHEAIAEALAPFQPQRRRRPAAGAGRDNPLTHREMEVAELVASGLTNREIARRLGIAEWTAVNHLRKIMRKLACNSRVQVANWVLTLPPGATE